MIKYLATIWETVTTLLTGMGVTWRHMVAIRRDNVTLQYPEERWQIGRASVREGV